MSDIVSPPRLKWLAAGWVVAWQAGCGGATLDTEDGVEEEASVVQDPATEDAPGAPHFVELPRWDQPGVTNYYIAPDGDDRASGTTPALPRATLAGLQSLLENRASDPHDVVIHVRPGDYVTDPNTSLQLDCKQLRVGDLAQGGRRTIIMPWGWKGGAGYASLPAPTDGYPSRRPRFVAGESAAGSAITLACNDGVATNFEIYYLSFELYLSDAIHLGTGLNNAPSRCLPVGAAPSPCWSSSNTVEGCSFYRIGDKYWSDRGNQIGYAAIKSDNSRDNVIRNNLFVKIRNEPRMVWTPNRKYLDAPGLVHGIYLFEFSSHDLIVGNLFDRISGDAVKLRSSADGTTIQGNVFGRTFSGAAIVDKPQVGSAADGHRPECSSRDVLIVDNRFDCSDVGSSAPPVELYVMASTKEAGYRRECDAHDDSAPRLASGSQQNELRRCGQ
jgi:hypothetical protein